MKIDMTKLQHDLDMLLLEFPVLKDDEQLRHDMLEGSTDVFEVLDRMVASEALDSSLIKGIDDRIKELKNRKDRLDHRINVTRKMIFKVMEMAQLRKKEVPSGTVYIKKGVTKVIVTDENKLNETYWRIKKEVDKTKIKHDIMDGMTVDGAYISNGDDTVVIMKDK